MEKILPIRPERMEAGRMRKLDTSEEDDELFTPREKFKSCGKKKPAQFTNTGGLSSIGTTREGVRAKRNISD